MAAAETPPAMDYRMHRGTYERFLHLVKWFVIHMAVLLPALYFFIVAGQPLVGTALLTLAIALLIYGIVTIRAVAHDIGAAFTDEPNRT